MNLLSDDIAVVLKSCLNKKSWWVNSMVSSIKTFKLYVQETIMMLQKQYMITWWLDTRYYQGKGILIINFLVDSLLLWHNETKNTAMIISGGETWKQITMVSFAYDHQGN